MPVTFEINIDADGLVETAKSHFLEIVECEKPKSIQELKDMFNEGWQDMLYDHIWYSIVQDNITET